MRTLACALLSLAVPSYASQKAAQIPALRPLAALIQQPGNLPPTPDLRKRSLYAELERLGTEAGDAKRVGFHTIFSAAQLAERMNKLKVEHAAAAMLDAHAKATPQERGQLEDGMRLIARHYSLELDPPTRHRLSAIIGSELPSMQRLQQIADALTGEGADDRTLAIEESAAMADYAWQNEYDRLVGVMGAGWQWSEKSRDLLVTLVMPHALTSAQRVALARGGLGDAHPALANLPYQQMTQTFASQIVDELGRSDESTRKRFIENLKGMHEFENARGPHVLDGKNAERLAQLSALRGRLSKERGMLEAADRIALGNLLLPLSFSEAQRLTLTRAAFGYQSNIFRTLTLDGPPLGFIENLLTFSGLLGLYPQLLEGIEKVLSKKP